MSVSTLHLNKHSNPFKNDLEEAYPIKKKKLNTNSLDSVLLEENKSFNFKISSEKNDNKNFIEKKANPIKLNEIIQNKPSDNFLNFKSNRNRKEEVLLEPTNNSNNSKKINKSLQKYLNKIKWRKSDFLLFDEGRKINLNFLPHISIPDSEFNNLIIPVLPMALYEKN